MCSIKDSVRNATTSISLFNRAHVLVSFRCLSDLVFVDIHVGEAQVRTVGHKKTPAFVSE